MDSATELLEASAVEQATAAGLVEPTESAADHPTAPTEPPKKPPLVKIATDGMTATLELESECTEWDVQQALKKAGVIYGIDRDAVLAALRQVPSIEPVIVAHGLPIVDCQDAVIEYLFEAGKPRMIEQGGRVNWRELNLFESVVVGRPLAVKHPPKPGTPGKNVRGSELRVRPPRDCRVNLGPGVGFSDEHPNQVVATIAGVVRLDSSGKIAVDNTFEVQGDVDLALGNLDVEGSLLIHGTVREGFLVKAKGNVLVEGAVDKGCIIAGGSVNVKGPVFGPIAHPDSVEVLTGHKPVVLEHDWPRPPATIQAGQDIVAQFADNAVLVGGRDVLLHQEALHCNIQAEGRVIVGGSQATSGGLLGGFVSAAQEIIAFDLGSRGQARTCVRAGYDWLVPPRLEAINTDLASIEARIEEITSGLKTAMEQRRSAPLTTAQRIAAEQLRMALPPLQHAAAELKAQRAIWEDLITRPGAIRVLGTARAGSELTVDGITRHLDRDMKEAHFIVSQGGVVEKSSELPAAEPAAAAPESALPAAA